MLKKALLMSLICSVLVAMLAADIASAKRFGGGRSFGGKKSYSTPYSKPISPDKQASGTQQKQGQAGQAGSMPPRMGGLGGLFGGLLMGGLIGSLLFGGGHGGFGIFDLLLIVGGILLLKRFLQARKAAQATSGASYGAGRGAGGASQYYADTRGQSPPPPPSGASPQGGWADLDSEAAPPQDFRAASVSMPEGFDEQEFIEGAKAVYNRLQDSWDRRDLDDIAEFTTSEVFTEIEKQAMEDPQPGKTEVLMLNARVLEVKEFGGETVVTVYYDALLREETQQRTAGQVREVWHFSRKTDDAAASWKLSGIQQLED